MQGLFSLSQLMQHFYTRTHAKTHQFLRSLICYFLLFIEMQLGECKGEYQPLPRRHLLVILHYNQLSYFVCVSSRSDILSNLALKLHHSFF